MRATRREPDRVVTGWAGMVDPERARAKGRCQTIDFSGEIRYTSGTYRVTGDLSGRFMGIRITKSRLFAGLVLLLVMTGAAVVCAQRTQNPPTVLKLGTVAPEGSPWAVVLREFGESVSEASRGALTLEVGYGGVLGGEQELLRLCREGKVALIGVSTTIVAELAPELNVLEMPYLFHSHSEVDYIIENVVSPFVAPRLEAMGLILLFWSENGYKSLAATRPVRNLDEMKGLAVRTQQSAVYRAIFESLGMVTLPLGVTEVVPGLQSGLIQGFDNTPLFTYGSGLYYHVRYYTLTEHSFQPVVMLASRKALADIPEALQPAIFSRREHFTQRGRVVVRQAQREALAPLAASGVTVYEPNLDERASFIAATRHLYTAPEPLLGKSGAELLEKVQTALHSLRKLK